MDTFPNYLTNLRLIHQAVIHWRIPEYMNVFRQKAWECLGLAKGKLPSTTIIDRKGNEVFPYMTMNGILIDENSSEFRQRMTRIIMFPSFAMLLSLAEIENIFNEVFHEETQTFRQQGPFYILGRIRQIQNRLHNLLFLNLTEIDSDTKKVCSTIVKTHQGALNMKENLKLLIAMQ
jgi:hypothetical protein